MGIQRVTLISRTSKFVADRSGSVGLLFAISLVVLVSFVGASIDLGRAYSARMSMQAAADSAVLAIVSTEGATEPDLLAKANSFFASEQKIAQRVVDLVVTPETGTSGPPRVRATGNIETRFLNVLGMQKLAIEVVAEAGGGPIGSYVDLHIIVDVSGSMNIADGQPHIDNMIAAFNPYGGPQGCAFACHRSEDPSTTAGLFNGKTGIQIARENGIKLREDTIKENISNLLATLESSPSPNRFRVSLRSMDGNHTRLTGLISDYSALRSYVSQIPNRSDGTILHWLLPDVARELPAGGSGTQTSPKSIVLLITDGLDYQLGAGAPFGFDDTKCQTFKDDGHEMYVLNMLYPDASVMHGAGSKLDDVIRVYPSVQTALRNCASPGRYFEAGYAGSINAAFADIGQQIAGGTTGVRRLTR